MFIISILYYTVIEITYIAHSTILIIKQPYYYEDFTSFLTRTKSYDETCTYHVCLFVKRVIYCYFQRNACYSQGICPGNRLRIVAGVFDASNAMQRRRARPPPPVAHQPLPTQQSPAFTKVSLSVKKSLFVLYSSLHVYRLLQYVYGYLYICTHIFITACE